MPTKKGRRQIPVALTEEQIAVIDSKVDKEKKISRADVIRRALAAYFGDAWPEAELSWGGFSTGVLAFIFPPHYGRSILCRLI